VRLEDLVKYLTVTETLTNAGGNTSTRTLYSQMGLDMSRSLTHMIVGGAATLAGCSEKKTSTSPNGTLFYTKNDKDVSLSLSLHSSVRQDGNYYDYSTGYTLNTGKNFGSVGHKTVTVSYVPGLGLAPLSTTVTITVTDGTQPPAPEPTKHTVVLSSQAVKVDGVEKAFEVYNIDGSNYFKLRDLAFVLSGTKSQFSVDFDQTKQAVSCVKGAAYTPNGTELKIGEDKADSAVPSAQSLFVDGAAASLTAFNIGGNNFYKLRDLGAALGFNVEYDDTTRTMLITSAA
jgi:uncharacterized Zn-binding protein involved in type VI secretion